MSTIAIKDQDTLENMIDRYGLSDVLMLIAEIANEKACHVAENWQDEFTAKKWSGCAARIGYLAGVVRNRVG